MRRFIFLPILLLGFTTLFAQSRPKADDNLQKANKRPPTTTAAESKTKPENQPTTIEQNSVPSQSTPDSAEAVPDGEVLRVDTNLVTIPVKVSDRSGRFVAGLIKENFKIFEDGAEQEIAYFSNAEEPFTVALVLDMSYSSTFKIGEIHSAAMAFIAQLHPNDKVMVVSFDEEVHVLCEPTNDRNVLQAAIKTTQIASGTSLYEAVDLVVNKRLKKISGRKAIVLFTDGVDTTSRRVFASDNLRDVYETDSLIYPIEYDTFNDVQAMKDKPVIGGQSGGGGGGTTIPGSGNPTRFPIPGTGNPFPFPIPGTGGRTGNPSPSTIPGSPSPPIPGTGGNPSPLPFPLPTTTGAQGTSAEEYRKAQEYLESLANSTSGRVYKANTTVNLAQAFTNIANELRQIYSLGFYPIEEKAGKRRQLKVRVNQPGVAVRARDSYVVGKKK